MGGAATLISCNEQNNTTPVQKKQASAEELPFLICNADWDKFWRGVETCSIARHA